MGKIAGNVGFPTSETMGDRGFEPRTNRLRVQLVLFCRFNHLNRIAIKHPKCLFRGVLLDLKIYGNVTVRHLLSTGLSPQLGGRGRFSFASTRSYAR